MKYTISYITYDIVCQKTVPATSYTICTYDLVYDMNLQTYDDCTMSYVFLTYDIAYDMHFLGHKMSYV